MFKKIRQKKDWWQQAIIIALAVIRPIWWIVDKAANIEFLARSWSLILNLVLAPWFSLVILAAGFGFLYVRRKVAGSKTTSSMAIAEPGAHQVAPINPQEDALMGTVEELMLDDEIQRNYRFTTDERSHLRELLHGYTHQMAEWKQYVHLSLMDVDCRRVSSSSPSVDLKLQIRNYLPVPVRLVQVLESGGTIGGQRFGARYDLPPLPEGQDHSVGRWREREFIIRLNLTGSDVLTWLFTGFQHKYDIEWLIHGRWYLEVFGERRVAWVPSYNLRL